MNSSMIRYILGQVLRIEGVLMLFPCFVAWIYQETEGIVFLGVAVFTFLFGSLTAMRKPKSQVFYLKEGCVVTALSWILMSFFGRGDSFLNGCAF